MKGIDVQTDKSLKHYLAECTANGINFTVQKGEEFLDNASVGTLLNKDDIIITPVPAGAGLSDAAKVVLGILLFIYAPDQVIKFFNINPSGNLAKFVTGAIQFGATLLAADGVAGLTAPDSPSESEGGYLFGGPQNLVKQGIPVPLAYGELIVGGSPINFGFIRSLQTHRGGLELLTSTGQKPPYSDDPWSRYNPKSDDTGGSGTDNGSHEEADGNLTWIVGDSDYTYDQDQDDEGERDL